MNEIVIFVNRDVQITSYTSLNFYLNSTLFLVRMQILSSSTPKRSHEIFLKISVIKLQFGGLYILSISSQLNMQVNQK